MTGFAGLYVHAERCPVKVALDIMGGKGVPGKQDIDYPFLMRPATALSAPVWMIAGTADKDDLTS